MLKENKGKLMISSIIILLPMVVGIILWDKLPEVITTHWDFHGEPDGFSSKAFVVFGMPLILFALQFVCLLATHFGNSQVAQNKKAVALIFWIVPAVSVFIFASMYATALGKDVSIELIAPLLTGFLFIVLGNYLPKVKQNWVIGIKIPWTLKDEENWNKTHRLSGKIWVVGGFAVLLGTFIDGKSAYTFMIAALLVMVLVPTIYSYVLYKKSKKVE